MPTHEFLNAIKQRKAEVEGELEALTRLLTYHGEVSPDTSGGSKATTVKKTSGKTKGGNIVMTPDDQEKMRRLIMTGTSVNDILATFGNRYLVSHVYTLRAKMKKEGLAVPVAKGVLHPGAKGM